MQDEEVITNYLDTSKLNNIQNYTPSIELNEGLKKFIDRFLIYLK